MTAAYAIYRAHRAQFWREMAVVLAVVAMLPFVACLA